jgi:hypothetical protein
MRSTSSKFPRHEHHRAHGSDRAQRRRAELGPELPLKLWRAIEGRHRRTTGRSRRGVPGPRSPGRQENASAESRAVLIFLESSLVIRAMRDYFNQEIGEILIDTEEIYEQARSFMAAVMPGHRQPREALPRRHPAVLALPDRASDRVGVLAPSGACPRAARSSSTTPRHWSRST